MIKRKHVTVILFSSVIIAIVKLSTIAGYNLYLQWKDDSSNNKYVKSIYELTAGLFREEIALNNINIIVEDDLSFPGMPILEGSIKNNSSKIITSVLVEVSFVKSDGTVLYRNRFYPVGIVPAKKYFGSPNFFNPSKKTQNVLFPGEDVSFRHFLSNCSPEVLSGVDLKTGFAKGGSNDSVSVEYSIIGMSVK